MRTIQWWLVLTGRSGPADHVRLVTLRRDVDAVVLGEYPPN
jgi:hypothetical protein